MKHAIPLVNQYIAKRTPSGWETESITIPLVTDPMGAAVGQVRQGLRWLTPDFRIGLYVRNDDPAMKRNLCWRSFETGEFRRLTPEPLEVMDPFLAFPAHPVVGAATDDGRRVLFESQQKLTSDAPSPNGQSNLYEWVDGEVRLVGILPDGTPAPASVAGSGLGTITIHESWARDTMSEDGSRIFFTVPTGPQLSATTRGEIYMRENGESTLHISASQRTDCAGDPTCGGDGVPDPAPNAEGFGSFFDTATPDGSVVLFRSCRNLTDESVGGDCTDIQPVNWRMNLYRYDVKTGELEDLTSGVPGLEARAGDVIDITSGGKTIYVVSRIGDDAYVWSDGAWTHIGGGFDARVENSTWGTPRLSQMSRSGRYLVAQQWHRRPSADDPLGQRKLVLYDRVEGTLKCIACPQGSVPTGEARITGFQVSTHWTMPYRPRVIDVSESRVYFSALDRLVSEDRNENYDVYEYEITTGKLRLISGGTGSTDSHLLDITPDGSSVFFMTGERLVAADRDLATDVYVARVDGGFPEPEIVEEERSCEGDACQGTQSNPPETSIIGSVSFSGSSR